MNGVIGFIIGFFLGTYFGIIIIAVISTNDDEKEV